jgi:ribosomal protein S18 acetylase RimI-like enzyme
MIEYTIYNSNNLPVWPKKERLIHFLFEHLEDYGDPKNDIAQCVEYSISKETSKGGLIITAESNDEIVGCAVTNKTGMKDYIPENILVYIATHKKYRGKGVGKNLMQRVIENTEGNIALHVEPDNPARFLYQKLGFTNKYLEMRFIKK